MTCGIYLIVNTATLRKYVGQSLDIHKRWLSHWKTARDNKVKTKLYDAMRAYGKGAFEMIVLEECQRDRLNERETHWITVLGTLADGYNLIDGGGQDRRVLSTETRERMAAAQRGEVHSAESNEKRRAWSTGRKLSPEACAKVGDRHRGKVNSAETRALVSAANKGRPAPNKGKTMNYSPEAIAAMRKAVGDRHRGIAKSPEQREKMSAARKAWWAKKQMAEV